MHGANYRRGNGQPYARKKYIKGKPQIKIAKFQSGKPDNYDYCVQLLVNENVQIRHMAIEAARLSANKTIEKVAGENGYQSRLFSYPKIFKSVLLRENYGQMITQSILYLDSAKGDGKKFQRCRKKYTQCHRWEKSQSLR